MNRRDIELIAECLRAAKRLAAVPTQGEHTDGQAAITCAAEFLASRLQSNLGFDRAGFLAACSG
jgi:hypothetical protein